MKYSIKKFINLPKILRNKLLYFLTKSKNDFIREIYWNLRASDIHLKWGKGDKDFHVIKDIVEYVRPIKILDIGCGSGRLFPIYKALDIKEVVAQDISSLAVKLCRQNYPSLDYKYECKGIAELNYPQNYFDLIISTRVLSAVLPEKIENVINKLTYLSRCIYINEMTDTDYSGQSTYWFKHDYDTILNKHGFKIIKSGIIEVTDNNLSYNQNWFLYTKNESKSINNNTNI